MRVVLVLWGMGTFVVGCLLIPANAVAAGLAFVTATVAMGSAAIVDQVVVLRKELGAKEPRSTASPTSAVAT